MINIFPQIVFLYMYVFSNLTCVHSLALVNEILKPSFLVGKD